MQPAENPYRSFGMDVAANATVEQRADFITKTYLHLAGAIVAFVALEALLLSLPITGRLVESLVSARWGMLLFFGGFLAVSWIADGWARSATSLTTQYVGLSVYVLAEAIFFVPLLYFAGTFHPQVIPTAAVTTLGLFAVLTAVVFLTRADFSFLRSVLIFGSIAAFGLILCGFMFQFALGPIFTYAMIALACGFILYDTSNVLHHYRIGQHVAASLALFASVALLFWYVLRFYMNRE